MKTILRFFIIIAIMYRGNEDYDTKEWDRVVVRFIGMMALAAYTVLMERM